MEYAWAIVIGLIVLFLILFWILEYLLTTYDLCQRCAKQLKNVFYHLFCCCCFEERVQQYTSVL